MKHVDGLTAIWAQVPNNVPFILHIGYQHLENRVQRRILDLHGRKWWEAGKDSIISFTACRLHQIVR
jgi:hypothetical protein